MLDTGPACSYDGYMETTNRPTNQPATTKENTMTAPKTEIVSAYLNISGDNLNFQIVKETIATGDRATFVVATCHASDIFDFCQEHGVEDYYCSSDIDFPTDCTDNEMTIAACREIRA